MKIDYYVPTNDVLLVNNTFHIIAICLISVIMFYFFKEKRKLKVKNWEDFINEEERLIKIRDVEFMIDSQQSSVFENKLDELFFKMKSFLENNKPYKNPNYSISDISKALNEKDIKIIQAITYHNDKIKFKDLLNYYRIKEAKKLLLANESIFEQMYSNVGFKNHAKFCEIFTYFEGMSPEEFMIKNYSAMV